MLGYVILTFPVEELTCPGTAGDVRSGPIE